MSRPNFSGTWRCITHDQNFDEYMTVLKRGYFFRKTAAYASITKELSFAGNEITDSTVIAGLVNASSTFPIYENEEEERGKGIQSVINSEEVTLSGFWDGEILVFRRIPSSKEYENILRLRKVDDTHLEITMIAIGGGKTVTTLDTYELVPPS
jgi:hypothetical protein